MAEWKATIEGVAPLLSDFHDGDIDFESARNGIVEVLRRQPFFKDGDEFFDIVECDLANAEDISEFDDYMDSLYDWADDNRVWIDPLK
jgi:hypothetical protein